eukprot:GILK01011589.1.p1 GENE.GILK01011589.1~~GILK01011589.1.p1  ORF type:complete len:401 (+),score=27.24 GILK01011589.1:55-1203(+)
MQAPDTSARCLICSLVFVTVALFVEHLGLNFFDVNADFDDDDDNDGKPRYAPEESKCCRKTLANSNPWVCTKCQALGTKCQVFGCINFLRTALLGRCPVQLEFVANDFPQFIPDLNSAGGKQKAIEVTPPKTHGPYTLIRELGCGAFSKVYLALSDQGQPVALKVPTDNRCQASELKILRTLTEKKVPNVAELISVEKFYPDKVPTSDAFVFALAQRLCDGNLSANDFPKEHLLENLRQLALALTTMWSLRICHFDVKPMNILWQRESSSSARVFLADFGSAIQYDGNMPMTIRSGPTTKIGTAAFHPDEMSGHGVEVDGMGFDACSLGKTFKALHPDDKDVLDSIEKLTSKNFMVRIEEVHRLASTLIGETKNRVTAQPNP